MTGVGFLTAFKVPADVVRVVSPKLPAPAGTTMPRVNGALQLRGACPRGRELGALPRASSMQGHDASASEAPCP